MGTALVYCCVRQKLQPQGTYLLLEMSLLARGMYQLMGNQVKETT